ncbi:MAG: nucleoside hydrolase [Bacteroidota bacterium]
MNRSIHFFLFLALLGATACQPPASSSQTDEPSAATTSPSERMRIILDTDANNELDDQHAIAYLLFNADVFETEGVTVNRTRNGGMVDGHLAEAERVIRLCDQFGDFPLLAGANGSFEEIAPSLDQADFDGHEAVNFIIERAKAESDQPLILVPIGKLTNIALALAKAPEIIPNIRIVWLGSNYPEPGEYNQDNDTSAMSYLLNLELNSPLEMVTVRYGKPSGSDAVRATPDDIETRMAGAGPRVEPAVVGRHGNAHHHFGDYALRLFQEIELHGDPPSRALFDVVALAILKHPDWGEKNIIPAPRLVENEWQEQPENPISLLVWENFDSPAILEDFYQSMQPPSPAP